MLSTALLFCAIAIGPEFEPTPVDGFNGIWYANQKTNNEYVYKYSGGLGTYCAKHIPQAVYAPEVNKTFFVYGGSPEDKRNLLEMISYYDHATGEVARPRMVIDKKTTDAHDNPVIAIDDDGHIFVFASAHGNKPPSWIFRSVKPYDITSFQEVADYNYSYPQPWYIEGKGFLFLHTIYTGGRKLHYRTSKDGVEWSDPVLISGIDEGHYQVSWPHGDKVGTAFNYHPKGQGLNFRTNLYYIQTKDMGETWTTITGDKVELPITTPENNARIKDYSSEGLLCYMKDIQYDADGNPIILHVTSKGWKSGPENNPREWRVAHWDGSEWQFHVAATSDNNYDMGSLYVDGDGTWRIIAPINVGPQAFNPGGEIAVVESKDQGKTWTEPRALTSNSERNHTYVRRPLNAQPDFAGVWADGHGRQPSISRLYFTDREGTKAYQLPPVMDSDMAKPLPIE